MKMHVLAMTMAMCAVAGCSAGDDVSEAGETGADEIYGSASAAGKSKTPTPAPTPVPELAEYPYSQTGTAGYEQCQWSGTTLLNFSTCYSRAVSDDCAIRYDANHVPVVTVADLVRPTVTIGKPTLQNSLAGQREATAQLRYFYGDTTALAAADPRRGPWDRIRALVESGKADVREGGTGEKRCGLPVNLVRIGVYANPSVPYAQSQADANELQFAIQDIWYNRSAFYTLRSRAFLTNTLSAWLGEVAITSRDFDPEPAQVTAPLAGSSGASASAVYMNSQTPTTVRKWPATFVSGGTTPPVAGTPCSPTDLAAGQEAVRSIFKSGTLYKCL